jgi:hypothetical protein
MAITYVTKGTAAAGGTAISIPYPAGISANDAILAGMVTKHPPNGPSTPAGYTLLPNSQGTGGVGANAVDSGTVYCTVFYKLASGSESGGTLAITVPSGNSNIGNIVVYRNSGAGYEWVTPVAGNGSDNSAGTGWVVTSGSTMDIVQNDWVVVFSAINSDAQTFSAEAMAMSGITTWGTVTERTDTGTTSGNDSKIVISDHPATGGTASTAGTYIMTANGSTAGTQPAGASVFIRLREQASTSAATITPGDGFQAQTGDTAAVYTTYFITGSDGFQVQTGHTAAVYAMYLVTPVDGFQAQTGDAAGVSFAAAPLNVTPADGFQAQTGDVVSVSAGYPVTASDGFQTQTGDTAAVRAGYPTSPQEGNQTQLGDSAVIYANYPLAPAQGFQTQSGDAAGVSFAGIGAISVTPSDGFQTQTGDVASLSGLTSNSSVTPGDGFQAQTGDTASVFSGYPIAPPDGFQPQSGDVANVYSGYYIDFSQGYQAQLGDMATVSVPSSAAAQTPRYPVVMASTISGISSNQDADIIVSRDAVFTAQRKNIEA